MKIWFSTKVDSLSGRRLNVGFQLENDIAGYSVVVAVGHVESFLSAHRLPDSRQLDGMGSLVAHEGTRGVVPISGIQGERTFPIAGLVQRQPRHL